MAGMARNQPSLGTRIRRARERARLSQEELATAVGASVRAISDWENDRRRPRNRLGVLEEVLSVRLDDEDEPEPSIPEDLRQDILNADGLTSRERQAVIASIEETLARERGGGAVSAPGDGDPGRMRSASLSGAVPFPRSAARVPGSAARDGRGGLRPRSRQQ